MRKATQFKPDLQAKENLMIPLAHSPLRARIAGRAGFKAVGCAERIRPRADRIIGPLESGVRKAQEVHPLGRDASDEALIRAIGEGDRHAMALLYGRHYARVYRFALRITGAAALAEDIVSQVFLDVWRQASGFKARARVSTWLLAITRNKSLSAVERGCDQQLDGEALELQDPTDDPETFVHKAGRSRVIRRCLSQLSAVQREVIDLVYYHEKSVAEVAEILGVPASTVKTRMFYARQRIRELLKAAGHDGI
jgi:RNA polymerase sigma-70 factor, ECF subfamily